MGYTNNTDSCDNTNVEQKDHGKKTKVAINSIQTAAYVKRLCVNPAWGINQIYTYDNDNLYPQKVLSIRDRSHSLSSATKTLSDFITGDGFIDENLNELVINEETGATVYDLLRNISEQKSVFGFAIHFNYTITGEIAEINFVDFEDYRVNFDKMLVYNKDWAQHDPSKDVYYHPFNPNNVIEEIREEGIENYNGQILYWTGTNKIYPLSTFDAALDSGQYQAENELFKLRNIQNDFSASGVLRYPMNLDTNNAWKEAIQKVKTEGTGADNQGRILFMGVTPDTEGSAKIWESFERSNVDKLFEMQNKEAKETIFSVFRQPQILGGVKPDGGWPNQQELEDAFVYYNSIVEQDRKEIERVLTIIFDNSIWGTQNVQIAPKMLIKAEEKEAKQKEVENGAE
jgi:hypothetical protein